MLAQPQLTRHRFTVEEYHAVGPILPPAPRVELIDGEIVDMSPIGPKHLWTVNNLNDLLHPALGTTVAISSQNPVRLSPHDEPKPDVALLRPSTGLRQRIPLAADVYVLIEVSDATLARDVGIKAPLYAGSGIEEFWIVDVDHDVIEQHMEPLAGRYTHLRTYRRGQTITSVTLPQLTLAVDDILPAPHT